MLNENDLIQNMEDFLDDEEAKLNFIDSENNGFCVESLEQANYILEKIKKLRDEKEQIKTLAKSQIDNKVMLIKEWESKNIKTLEQQETFFTEFLKSFAKENYDKTKKKTIKLPNGNLTFSKPKKVYEYDDKEILKCLQNNEELTNKFIKIKPSFSKTELKSAGEIIDGKLFINNKEINGVTVIENDELEFNVKTN